MGYIVPTVYKCFPLYIFVAHIILYDVGKTEFFNPHHIKTYPTLYTHIIYSYMVWVYSVGYLLIWCGLHFIYCGGHIFLYGVGNIFHYSVLLMLSGQDGDVPPA